MLRRQLATFTRSRPAVAVMAPVAARRLASSDEQAELDREAKLRQDFITKKTQQAQSGGFFQRLQAQAEMAQAQAQAAQAQAQAARAQQGGGGAGGNPQGGFGFGGNAPPGMPQRPSFGQLFYSFLVYSTAFYLLIITYQMRKSDQSSIMALQGVPQFAAPTEANVAYLITRVMLSSAKQQELQQGFEAYSKINPSANFYQYIMMQPSAIAGRSTTQAEFLTSCVAVAQATKNADWTSAITRLSRYGDDQAKVDAAMANLKSNFGQYLTATSPVPAGMGHTPSYGMNVPYGQQAYGYGGQSPAYGMQQQQGDAFNQSQPQQQQQQPSSQDTPQDVGSAAPNGSTPSAA